MKEMSKSLTVLSIVILITITGTYDFVLAEQRFIDHGNGTVTDRKLGLMWAKTDNQTDLFWDQIQGWLTDEFPDTIPQLYDNWRLPTISELQSLYVEALGLPLAFNFNLGSAFTIGLHDNNGCRMLPVRSLKQ